MHQANPALVEITAPLLHQPQLLHKYHVGEEVLLFGYFAVLYAYKVYAVKVYLFVGG